MGYSTDFSGRFDLDKPLAPEHSAYLKKFSGTRRMNRDSIKAELLDDPTRIAAGLPVGPEGSFFVGAGGMRGQDKDDSVADYNSPPFGQPSLWCQWIPTGDGKGIEWDGGEKFYAYVKWIEYIVNNFLAPWGYKLSGTVKWSGEERGDIGEIVIEDNHVEAIGE